MMKAFLMYIILAILVLFIPTCAMGQIAADTSYTVHSTYNKELKKFPFISIAKRNMHDEIAIKNDVVYRSIGGRQLYFDTYYNDYGMQQPIVILIHGGGWKSGNKSQMHLLAQEIAAKGYACFCIEYRLSVEAQYPAAIHDVKAAIKFIKDNAAEYNADAKRVAVLGCSSGGQMAALVGATNGNKAFEDTNSSGTDTTVQAVIDMDGILAFHHPESKEGKVAAQWLGGSYEQEPQVWKQASALTNAGNNMPPILFINSDMPRFHAGRDDMIAILDKYKIYNDVKTITGSPHSFWFFDPWFDDLVEWSTDFLDKVLKNK